MLSYNDIICRNYIINYNIQRFSLPISSVSFGESILSSGNKLEDADPTGTLDSFYGTQNEHKNAQNNAIEVEIRNLSK